MRRVNGNRSPESAKGVQVGRPLGEGARRRSIVRPPGAYNNETILLDSPGNYVFNWYENNCTVLAGRSVEQDWLRHYWNFLTDAGTKPTILTLAEHVRRLHQEATWNSTNVFTRLGNVWDDADMLTFEQRWLDLAAVHGVDW